MPSASSSISNQLPVVGQGELRYRPVPNWPKLPSEIDLVEVVAVAADDRTSPAGGVAGTFGGPRSVTLAPGAASSVSFAWTTTRASVGTHVLTATASTVAGETRVADNSRSRSVTLTVPTFAPTAATVSSGDSTTETVAAIGEEPEERPRLRTGLAEPSAAR